MLEAITYENMLKDIKNNEILEDTIGILITRPDLATGKNILDSLPYFHHLTGHNINFYLPGYGAYWNETTYPDKHDVVNINGTTWSFSNIAFINFINDLEDYTSWTYSGESELLLISYKDKTLDFSSVSLFKLDQMLRDNTISSISAFFTQLSRFARKHQSNTVVSTKIGTTHITKSLLQDFINSLPSYISTTIKEGKHFVSHDYSK